MPSRKRNLWVFGAVLFRGHLVFVTEAMKGVRFRIRSATTQPWSALLLPEHWIKGMCLMVWGICSPLKSRPLLLWCVLGAWQVWGWSRLKLSGTSQQRCSLTIASGNSVFSLLVVAAFEKQLKHWEWDQFRSSCEDGGTAVAFHFSVSRNGPCSYYGRFLYVCKYIYSFYNCQDNLLSLWICCRHAQVDFCFLLYFITVVKCALCCCF